MFGESIKTEKSFWKILAHRVTVLLYILCYQRHGFLMKVRCVNYVSINQTVVPQAIACCVNFHCLIDTVTVNNVEKMIFRCLIKEVNNIMCFSIFYLVKNALFDNNLYNIHNLHMSERHFKIFSVCFYKR